MTTAAEQREVREACEGSLQAFEALVHRYERRVYAFVSQFCRNPEDAREITQDTFVRAFQALDRLDTQQSFCPWLFTIARRKCVDFHRRRAPSSEELPEELPAPGPSPDSDAAERDEADLLWARVRRALPPRQYEVVWLHYAEGLGVAEIAGVLELTPTHVKVLLFRARQRLVEQFAAERRPTAMPSLPLARPAHLNLNLNSEV